MRPRYRDLPPRLAADALAATAARALLILLAFACADPERALRAPAEVAPDADLPRLLPARGAAPVAAPGGDAPPIAAASIAPELRQAVGSRFTGAARGSFVASLATTPARAGAASAAADQTHRRHVLLENTSTGLRALWVVERGVIVDAVSLGVVPTDWRIAGAGDFNDDGKEDIVWRSQSSGGTTIWLMDGAAGIIAVQNFFAVHQSWRIAGVGDYDHDGIDDILWENTWVPSGRTPDGVRAVWLMDGAGRVTSAPVLGTLDPLWRMMATGDLNSDGKDDILVRHQGDGRVVLWLMSGGRPVHAVLLGTMPLEWQLVASTDIDGDGNEDALWEHTTSGARAVWLMNGAGGVTSAPVLTVESPSWHIAAALIPQKPIPAGDGTVVPRRIDAYEGRMCVLSRAGQPHCIFYGTRLSVVGSPSFAAIAVGQSDICGLTAIGRAYCWGSSGFGFVRVSGGLTFSAIGAGQDHTCALAAGGRAYCWGSNQYGQLGVPATTPSSLTPIAVGGGHTFVSLSVGWLHTCAVDQSGQAYCWGYNSTGQLGNGTTTSSNAPVPVSGGIRFTSVVAGSPHSCGLTAAGKAYCWGYNFDGQVGNGRTGEYSLVPAPVSGDLVFAQLDAWHNTCGVTVAGQAHCWGNNSVGELGTGGASSDRPTPQPVTGGLSFVAIALHRVSTCAMTASDEVYCWGDTGQAPPTDERNPVPVLGGLSFTSIAAGGNHTCALAESQAYCWGNNGDGQLGDATEAWRGTPTAVAGGFSFAHVDAGNQHTCALTSTGRAYCWGSFGDLGVGLTHTPGVATPVAGGLTFADLAAAGPTCAVTVTTQRAYCWGSNSWGQVGNGTTSTAYEPAAVTGGHSFASVTTGNAFSCGLTVGGQAYCWGQNLNGQLGNGTTTGLSSSPVAVSGGLTFASIEAGGSHVCAIASSGVTYCWGSNGAGQLGTGTTTGSTVPVAVGGGMTFESLSAGASHTCGRISMGSIYCWGSNSLGQIGNGATATAQVTPTLGGGGLAFTSFSAEANHTCGVVAGGQAYCWGYGAYGQLGNGKTRFRFEPTRLPLPL